jgi:hypothetical protein
MKIILLSLIIHLSLFADLNFTKKEIGNFRKTMTTGFYETLNTIDCYLCDYNDTNRSNYNQISKNKLQIILSAKDLSKDSAKFALRLRGKIELPQIKEKLELTFSQNDDEQMDNHNISSGSDDIVEDEKLHVGLKYYLYKKRKSKAYGKISFRLHSPFGLYAKFGVDKSYLTDNFLETVFNNALFYYINENKFSASSSVSFFKPITVDYWLGQQNKLYWKSKDSLYLSHNITLYQIFGINDRILYRSNYTTSYNKTELFKHDSVSFSIGYFHRFDKWFFVEMIPEYKKRRSNDYRSESLFTLNFGILLGN